jgi:acyl-[acyl-carrier-protein] desaturase
MSTIPPQPEPPELERAFWRLYRDFLDLAERKRRWSIRDDIPWDRAAAVGDPAVADVIESFCAVELYLPDYTSKVLPVVRSSRGRTWFYANWGYEESKHSLALGDWLVKSGWRTEEQLADLETMVFQREWDLPHDDRLGMLIYAMTQELATFLAYRNLRQKGRDTGGDPALEKLLMLLAVDERAHFDFFKQCVQIFLKHDREATLQQLRRVMNNFTMPAIHDLVADSRRRVAAIKALDVMSEDIYYRDVYLPLLQMLDVDRREMRNRVPEKKSARSATF